MITHLDIANTIINYLNIFYYSNLQKVHSIPLNQLFSIKYSPILRPEYFVFKQYYLIYLFLYNITHNNTIRYSLFLHLFYISGIIFERLLVIYQYKPHNNINFLKYASYIYFMYLYLLKLLFMNIHIFKKTTLISSTIAFYSLVNINELYNARYKSIKNKEIFNHPLKILIVTPNINTIKNIIHKTRLFTFSNMLLFINVSLFLLL